MGPFDDLTAAQRTQIRAAHAAEKERAMREQAKVKVGQVWADNDRRAEGRTVRVDEVRPGAGGGAIAVCTILTNSNTTQEEIDNPHEWLRTKDMRGKRTEIAVRRMRPTSTGYRLIEDVEG